MGRTAGGPLGCNRSLTGTGASSWGSAVVTITPTSFNFPAQTVGTTSGPLDVRIFHCGTTRFTITSITINGVDFLLTNFCGGGLSPGFACDVWVKFKPTAVGSLSGSLDMVRNAGTDPDTVSLTGTGKQSWNSDALRGRP